MSLSLYRPFRLSEMMDRMVDDSLLGQRSMGGFGIPMDVYVDDEGYTIHALVPGLKAEDLNVQVTDNTVIIEGEVPAPANLSDKSNCLLQEIRYGRFSRSVAISGEIDGAKAEAHVENGLLTLRIPKAEAAKPKLIKVRAK